MLHTQAPLEASDPRTRVIEVNFYRFGALGIFNQPSAALFAGPFGAEALAQAPVPLFVLSGQRQRAGAGSIGAHPAQEKFSNGFRLSFIFDCCWPLSRLNLPSAVFCDLLLRARRLGGRRVHFQRPGAGRTTGVAALHARHVTGRRPPPCDALPLDALILDPAPS